ncbi:MULTISPECIES: DUF1329 domain-containing protein [Pseudomonas]|uniref:DUF1329 domain-containing protein n=1 Tax=Pseudomonas nitroreducens TaxID=46680 RepID=UPI001E62D50B|nr:MULTISPECIES: DUF1329 domain-containing protein [Pseudomonas]MCE4071508.1 DUF1329 domain-containing protein [Pseudomonas nitritireducens]MCE4081284.1 DUF1329 domain-containing protein [Pseudomonas nitroreducens]
MKHSTTALLAAVTLSAASGLSAQASNDEIKLLGSQLTPWGAEKAGNADGSIPEYTGGISSPPPGFDRNSGHLVDPYAAEKPRLIINASNIAQYHDKLTPGTIALLQRWPEYRLDVYPTHRSYPAMSESRAQGTLANARNPQCKTSADGVGLQGCWYGTPFPIPKTGYEVMWNHQTRDQLDYELKMQSWIVDASGNPVLTNESFQYADFPYWHKDITPYQGAGEYYYRFLNRTVAPARDAGQKALIWYPAQFDKLDQRTWSYTTGQRRTRLAPEMSYDTPSASLSGAMNYDELSLFSGRMDRFDFKLVGKKEMFLPYNQFRYLTATPDKLIGKQYVNPDHFRWELHRVWVVEATRKEGKRHIAAKRRFYVDEDSWTILAAESIDDSGKIFRVGLSALIPWYDRDSEGNAGTMSFASITYDLTRGQYVMAAYVNPETGSVRHPGRQPDHMFRSENMAGTGVR